MSLWVILRAEPGAYLTELVILDDTFDGDQATKSPIKKLTNCIDVNF